MDREELVAYLRDVIAIAFKKVRYVNTPNSEKAAWSRIIVNVVSACTPLINDADLDKLKTEIDRSSGDLNTSSR